MATENELCERLRDAIRADGRSLAEIARAAGMAPPNLSRFMTGKPGGSMATWITIADAVGMRIDIRFDNDEVAKATPAIIESDTAEPKPCQCGKPIVIPTECRDCRIARKRSDSATTPGTGLVPCHARDIDGEPSKRPKAAAACPRGINPVAWERELQRKGLL